MTNRFFTCRRLWVFCSFKMFHFRTILVNTSLFILGILTTLIVIANREETIDLCDLTVVSQQLNPSVDPSFVQLNPNSNVRGYIGSNQVSQESFNLHSHNNNAYNHRNTNVSHGNTNDDDTNNNNSHNNGRVLGQSTDSPVVGNGDKNDHHYAEASINVNNLLLPFSSSVTKNNIVYVVTPTYNRPEQIPELTRLAQALLQVNRIIHWVIVEDVDRQTPGLDRFLNRFNLNYSILKSVKPTVFNKVVGKPRGVGGRRAALDWLREKQVQGIVYFADDDNTYDSEIFRQMQKTKKVSMWPVGLVTDLGVSSPIVREGRVIGFYDGWRAYRKFPVDMAGFAINIKLLHDKKNANMPWVAGYEEDAILRSLGISLNEIQPLARNCTEILVWHSKSIKFNWSKKATNLKPGLEVSTNLNILLKKLPQPNGTNSNNKNNQKNNLSNNNDNNEKGSNGGFSFLQLLFGNT